jgi:hypothetical protein
MLNVKYVIKQIKKERISNNKSDANGNAWFVNDIKLVNKANDEMKMLDRIDTKAAIFNIHLYGKNARLKKKNLILLVQLY